MLFVVYQPAAEFVKINEIRSLSSGPNSLSFLFFFFFAVLEFELGTLPLELPPSQKFVFSFLLSFLSFLVVLRQVLYHLSHSTSPVLCWVFSRQGPVNYLPKLVA
jgi:hypothetical protein